MWFCGVLVEVCGCSVIDGSYTLFSNRPKVGFTLVDEFGGRVARRGA